MIPQECRIGSLTVTSAPYQLLVSTCLLLRVRFPSNLPMKHHKLLLIVIGPLILSSQSPAALVWTGLGANPNDFYDNGNWDAEQMYGGPIVAGQPIFFAESQVDFVGATVVIRPPTPDFIFEFQSMPTIWLTGSDVTFQPGAGMNVAPRFNSSVSIFRLSKSFFTHTGIAGIFDLEEKSGVSFTTGNFAPSIAAGVDSYFERISGSVGVPNITNTVSNVRFSDDWAAAKIRNPADPASALWNFKLTGSDPDPTNGFAEGDYRITAIEPVPEPAAISLCGLALLAGCLRRKRQ